MRADKYLTEKFGSRSKAQQALLQGLVLRGGKPLSPSDQIGEGDALQFLEEEEPFISNGGRKLARGLDAFSFSPKGLVAADLGSSTGGFCDCLLQRGAKRVYCVDVGKSQLSPTLATDDRVVVMDGTNARYLTRESFPEAIGLVTADLSFISLRLVFGAIHSILSGGKDAFLLFKPQFECEGKGLGKSGILPVSRHAALLRGFYTSALATSLFPQAIVNAPIRPKKNVEYIVWLKADAKPVSLEAFLASAATLS